MNMVDPYARFVVAFRGVEAWAVLAPSGQLIARVAIKHPQRASGRVHAYVRMAGSADVYHSQTPSNAYCTADTAVYRAMQMISPAPDLEAITPLDREYEAYRAMLTDWAPTDRTWDSALRRMGFVVAKVL